LGLLSRIFRPSAVRAAEGEYREGPYTLPISGGWLPAGSPWNFWQLGRDVERGLGTSAMVEACVSAYAQTIAMCPGSHWVENADNGRDRQTTQISSLARVLRTPNSYQSISDFLVNATRRLYLTGNTFALALRNNRFEINELHLMLGDCRAQVGQTGEVFYTLSGNELIERRFDGPLIVPARDVLHIKLHTPRHPLIGETPLQAAMLDLAVTGVISQQQLAFYHNQARPSFILSTDQILNADQMKQLRGKWDEQSQYLAAGGTPIMSAGLKPLPIYSNATDSQLAEVLKMSDQHIALAYRVPLQILGIGGTPFASTEALMQSWRASGLGFALNHVEEAFGQLFGLRGQPEEYVEFDTSVLLRSSFKERVEGAVAGIRGGLFAPNEARAEFSLSKQEYGDLVRVQQQDVPLSYGVNLQPPDPKPAASPPPAEQQPVPPPPPQRDLPNADRSAVVRSLFAAADDYDRRAA
jgi:HK97 family phage portal protein